MKTKRLLAMLLMLTVLVGLLPMAVYADDTTVQDTCALMTEKAAGIRAEPAAEFKVPAAMSGDTLLDVGDREYDETEPNNSASEASVIRNDYTVYGVISRPVDVDYFTFTLSQKSEITILIGAERRGLTFLLMDSGENGLAAPNYTDTDSLYYDGLTMTLDAGTLLSGAVGRKL